MNKLNLNLGVAAGSDLERVLEPLTSYICAADQPKAVLRRVLAAIRSEVEQTNRAAKSHLGVFAESC